MFNVEEYASRWSKVKYSDAVLENEYFDTSLQRKTQEYLEQLGIANKYMDGFSTENLPRVAEAEGVAGGLNMSSIFHKISKLKEISPAIYVAVYITEFLQKYKHEHYLLGYLGRALRSFGSFLREPDLAFKLKRHLDPYFRDVSVSMDAYQDTKQHVDILLSCDHLNFNIWSYQATQRGLPNTIERLTEKRGEVALGLNILCPLNTEDAKVYVKRKETLASLKKKLDMYREELADSTDSARKKRLIDMIARNNQTYVDKFAETKVLGEQLAKELVIKDGWYLHADDYINRVSSMILGYVKRNSVSEDYRDVKKMLETPQIYVRNIHLFKK